MLHRAVGLPVEVGGNLAQSFIQIAYQEAAGGHPNHSTWRQVARLGRWQGVGFRRHLQWLSLHYLDAQATIDRGLIVGLLRRSTEPQAVERHLRSTLRHAERQAAAHQLVHQYGKLLTMQGKDDGVSDHRPVMPLVVLEAFQEVVEQRITGIRFIEVPLRLNACRRHS
ncbi:hypothetical protein D9M68_171010 [compost metagenome]